MYMKSIRGTYVIGMPTLNLPDVCTESPAHGKAFCPSHCVLLEEKAPGVPIGLRDFLKYSGAPREYLSG